MTMTRTALITGCSSPSGVGANFALSLSKMGYRVFAAARDVERMGHLKDSCELIQLDVNDEASRLTALEKVQRITGGRLDVLVNNAGIDANAPALDTSLAAFRDILETNLVSPLAMIQLFAPLLIAAANDPRPGLEGRKWRKSVVVNIGNIAVWGSAWKGAYDASKAGLEVLSDVLRLEMANLNVRVLTCELGLVLTDMYKRERPFPNLTNPTLYYSIYYSTIAPRLMQGLDYFVAKNLVPTADSVADKIALSIDRAARGSMWGGGIIHVGTLSTIMSWLVPLFEKLGWKDWLFTQSDMTNLVETPKSTSSSPGQHRDSTAKVHVE